MSWFQKEHIGISLIFSFHYSGLRNPQLMSNWKYLLPDHPKARELHEVLMQDLQEITEKVDKLNEAAPNPSRPRKFESFNPKYLECSVSA